MSKIVGVTGSSVSHCLAGARRELGIKFQDSREELRSGGEDGLYRVHLSNGDICECTVIHQHVTEVHSIREA